MHSWSGRREGRVAGLEPRVKNRALKCVHEPWILRGGVNPERLKSRRDESILAQRFRDCYETHFVREPAGKQLQDPSPGGAIYTSPALQRLLRNSLCARAGGKAASRSQPRRGDLY